MNPTPKQYSLIRAAPKNLIPTARGWTIGGRMRRVAVLGACAAVFALLGATVRAGDKPVEPGDPPQAVIFDGSVDSAYLVAFKDGFLSEGKMVLRPGSVASWPANSLTVGLTLLPMPRVDRCDPRPIAFYRNDCEAAEHLGEFMEAIPAILERARCLAARTVACRAVVHRLGEDIVTRASQLPDTFCNDRVQEVVVGVYLENVTSQFADDVSCFASSGALVMADELLAAFERRLSECESAFARFTAFEDELAAAAAGRRPICRDHYTRNVAAALSSLGSSDLQSYIAEIEDVLVACTPEQIAANCALCPGDDRPSIDVTPAGVEVAIGRQPLGCFVGALAKAGYHDLSKRLANVPNAGVRRYTFEARNIAVDTTIIALRRAGNKADPSRPAVVILNAVKPGTLPTLNVFGRDVIEDGLAAFRGALVPMKGGDCCDGGGKQ